jgi:hypothetical protein
VLGLLVSTNACTPQDSSQTGPAENAYVREVAFAHMRPIASSGLSTATDLTPTDNGVPHSSEDATALLLSGPYHPSGISLSFGSTILTWIDFREPDPSVCTVALGAGARPVVRGHRLSAAESAAGWRAFSAIQSVSRSMPSDSPTAERSISRMGFSPLWFFRVRWSGRFGEGVRVGRGRVGEFSTLGGVREWQELVDEASWEALSSIGKNVTEPTGTEEARFLFRYLDDEARHLDQPLLEREGYALQAVARFVATLRLQDHDRVFDRLRSVVTRLDGPTARELVTAIDDVGR